MTEGTSSRLLSFAKRDTGKRCLLIPRERPSGVQGQIGERKRRCRSQKEGAATKVDRPCSSQSSAAHSPKDGWKNKKRSAKGEKAKEKN